MEKKEEEMTLASNPARKVLRKMRENKNSLHIARVPPKTKVAFTKFADDEFCGDWGMALKWLMDDTLSMDTRMIMARIEDHERRILELEGAFPKKVVGDEKGELIATTFSGKEIRKKKKVKE